MGIFRGTGGTGDATTDAVASQVGTDASTASTKANEAASSATDAATSATAAAAAETAAETAQAAAVVAKTAAETAETNAETAETNAETAETNAETAETNAASSATAAASSATAAATSASNAASTLASAALKANNLSDLANAGTARTNLGLGTAATTAATDYLSSTGGSVTGDVDFISTDAGSSAGPEFTLFRNSSSPADGDYLGQVKFDGKSDTGVTRVYAKITGKTSDVSNGTEDGLIETAVKSNGSNVIVSRQTGSALKLINGCAIEVDGTVTATGGTSTNWNTAYGWGNHASAGYLTSSSTLNASNMTTGTLDGGTY